MSNSERVPQKHSLRGRHLPPHGPSATHAPTQYSLVYTHRAFRALCQQTCREMATSGRISPDSVSYKIAEIPPWRGPPWPISVNGDLLQPPGTCLEGAPRVPREHAGPSPHSRGGTTDGPRAHAAGNVFTEEEALECPENCPGVPWRRPLPLGWFYDHTLWRTESAESHNDTLQILLASEALEPEA